MFGLPSPGKLLLLIVAVLAVWYGFKLYRRLEAARRAELRKSSRPPMRLDTVECTRCGTHVAAGAREDCERKDCPLA
ncbi:MAG: hypothetical protein EXQ88_00480 [Alphaproteobacteria bacterium]|nr:hypothetical protein [Alphaproteobacteria bacterium]